MDKMKKINMEWERMMESMNKIDELTKDMKGMGEMKREWSKMMGSVAKMNSMMIHKDMENMHMTM